MHRRHRFALPSHGGVFVLLLLVTVASHAQRVTDLYTSTFTNPDIGCIYPRCFTPVSALDGDTATTANLGTAVLVRAAPGVWSVQQVLWNPDGMPTLRYPNPMGGPSALQGDTLLLTGTSRKYSDKSVIYVWQRTGTTWAHTQVLALPRPAGYDDTRVVSIALSQGVAAVCGIREDSAATRSLAQIDIFVRQSDGRFQRQAQLNPAVTPGWDEACQLAMEGNTLLVTDPLAGEGSGRVHVYQRGSGGWTLRTRLVAADSSADARFGNSVAISGNTIAVGAPQRANFDQPLHLGAVYLFQRTASGWAQVQLLVKPEFVPDEPPYMESESQFGASVALSGDRLATAWHQPDGLTPLAYLYERRGVWAPVAGLATEAGLYPGRVWLSGSTAIQSISDGHSGSGNAIYDLPPLWSLPPRVDGP